jgi:hypothetical protein
MRLLQPPSLPARALRAPSLLCALALLGGACELDDPLLDDLFDTGADADADSGEVDSGPEFPDLTGTEALTVRFDLEGESFWDFPWPTDARLQDDGRVDMTGFPRENDPFVRIFLRALQDHVVGFSTMPVVYIGLSALPGAESVPTPAETLAAVSPVQLIDVSDEGCGARVPVEVRLSDREDRFLEPSMLHVAPVPGFTLRPSTPYALVVMTHFGVEDGLRVDAPAALTEALGGAGPLAELYAPLADCFGALSLPLERIGAATVFTTQNPWAELVALRDHVVDPETTDSPVVSNWRATDSASVTNRYRSWRGTFATPIFQTGDSPYASVGGELEFDESGAPIVQRLEDVPFMITFPLGQDGPFPVLIWEDGTGADLESHVTSNVTQRALSNGFAVATFEAQFHGDRASPGSDEELHTFNYLNPNSFRTNFLQQVADTAYFVRLLREEVHGLQGLPELDTSTLVYAGQSQGAIVGAITAGVETEITAYALNGIGGYLSVTMVERKDPIDINDQIRRLMGLSEPLDRFHPLVAVAQLGGDVSDPTNYALRWRGWEGHEQGNNVMLINGLLDHTTPPDSIASVTIAGDTAPVEPAGWDVDPNDVWDIESLALPLSGNTTSLDGSPLTIATFLDAEQGHFTIYRNDRARALAIEFLVTALSGTPIIADP